MSRASWARSVAIVALQAIAIRAAAQTVRTITLAEPAARLDHGFIHIAGVRELSDGRVVIVDSYDRLFGIADLATSGFVVVGRNGSGPNEYQAPAWPLALPFDTTAILDGAVSRLLITSATGQVVRSVDARSGSDAPSAAAARLQLPLRTDAAGRYYAMANPIGRVGGAIGIVDSSAIERWSAGSSRDTVGYIRVPHRPGEMYVSGMIVSRPRPADPFASEPQWAVAADGRVAVVEIEPYRVTLRRPGSASIIGPVIRYESVKVTAAEKALWREDAGRPRPVTTYGRGASGSSYGMRSLPVAEPPSWRPVFPAFPVNALSFDSRGRLWVQRYVAANTPASWDVIGLAGAVDLRVQIPRATRIAGFGNDVVYVVNRDADDVEYIERYRLPVQP